ncbi:type II secretion system F family protein [Longirhabdus pacifica]|uniref:type II secretion system F family protein n=1 Tax=Longirhabdus pacifica TaxID=2305227 RepID=UPI0013E8EAB5|nr:type II secretion system F family protein [Longirhabdus pacifica]
MFAYVVAFSLVATSCFLLIAVFSSLRISFSFYDQRVKEIRGYVQRYYQRFQEDYVPKNRQVERYDEQLSALQRPLGLNGKRFLVFQFFFTVFTGVFTFQLLSPILFSLDSVTLMMLGWASFFLLLLLLFVFPTVLLRWLIKKKERKVEKQFLYLVHYFQIFLHSGFTPRDIVKRVIPLFPQSFRHQLVRLYAEMQVLSDQEALQRFCDELKTKESHLFYNTILNHMQMGSDSTKSMQDLSRSMRLERKAAAVLAIKKKPFQILFPKMLFVIAALMFVLVPLLLNVYQITNY